MSYFRGSIPIGSLLPFAGTNLPKGFLWCDGSKYKIKDYLDLFKEINHNFDNQPHLLINENTFKDLNILESYFAVPDLRGRVPIGAGVGKTYPSQKRMMDDSGNGADLTPIILGQYNGENSHSLTSNEVADHIHYFQDWCFAEVQGNVSVNALGLNMDRSYGSSSGYDTDNLPFDVPQRINKTLLVNTTYAPQNENKSVQPIGAPHNNMQPYCGVNYIIKAFN